MTGTGCLYNAFLDTSQILIPSSLVAGGFGTLTNFIANDSGVASFNNIYPGTKAAYWDLDLSDGTNTIIVNDVFGNSSWNSTDHADVMVDLTPGNQAYETLPAATTWSTFALMSLSSLSGGTNTDTTLFGAYTVEGVTINIGGQESNQEQYAEISSITLAGTRAAVIPEPSSLLPLSVMMTALLFAAGERKLRTKSRS